MSSATVGNVQGGFLIPSAEEAREILRKLKEDVDKDSELKKRYMLNRGDVYGERGLSLPVQRALASEGNLLPTEGCVIASGCVCTGCGVATLSV